MTVVQVEEIMVKSKFTKFHRWLLFWGMFLMAFEGYDLVVFGTVVPRLMEDWSLSSVTAGSLSSYGLVGMMIGAITFGIMADRIGRKKVIIISSLLFSIFTGLCGFAPDPTWFAVARILAGIGLGGMMPNVIALITDYAPGKKRAILVAILMCGYSLGGILAPVLGMTIMPEFGWESVFWVAFLPILVIPFVMKQLPESPSYLLRSGKKQEFANILNKMHDNKEFHAGQDFQMHENKIQKQGPADLFKNNLALSTILFWIIFFCCLLMIFGLNTWLPNLMIAAGYGLTSSLAFLIALQSGSIIGSLIFGTLADRYGFKRVLVPLAISGAIALTLLGLGGNHVWIFFLVMVAGAASIGSQNMAQAYVSNYYPAAIRSTALGMASGFGRIGGMIGPLMGGVLLGMTLPNVMNFVAFAIPGLIVAIALACIPKRKVTIGEVRPPEEQTEETVSQ
ncbi:MAG: aromatic acid/H+ symport family MFS transporter [Kurthia sp.]|nr:aromatic acid/H+ symport family MFS transporter [Candidatus Kurthia equi]